MKVGINYFLTGAMALSLALLSTQANTAEYYRWLDERGNPVHSDRPPPKGVPFEVISSESSLVRRVNTATPPSSTTGTGSAATEPSETTSYSTQPEIEKNPEYCKQATENLETLETAPRIRIMGDDGKYRFLTDEEREAQKKNAHSNIAVHCE